ncbi:FAD-dependent oxidoreductase [Leptobacterium flavescens]|uniref:FAD-dependent oxidoreductase n=1 Tax=Leptobacterium flavescens TaxID=472055 RepID=A0A6P0ULL6_9FLAO|nr:FAD-dependent oxidoreductase [Leptobacterium flavescens]NER12808.1 FAD-dependent oxidoreductase [Leptobacterium flavescens]
MKSIIIIGGGIIGLSAAYYLQKEGHQVTVIDQSNMDEGASYVNAGYLTPSHIIPLAAPGVIKQGIKWMFNPKSPLYLKPRLEMDFLKWVWAFNKSANKKHVERCIPVIRDINLLSRDLYQDIKQDEGFNFQYEKKGLLMLCQTDKMLEEENEVAHKAIEAGLPVKELSLEELYKMEPGVKMNVKGAVHYECDVHTTPGEFMSEIKSYLKQKGVIFNTNEKVEDIEVKKNEITAIKTNKQTLYADEYVLAAGSWSTLLGKKLGISIPLQAGKGYRINTEKNTGITVPAILAEAKVAVTPMHGFTRFAGTMEVAGINHTINKVRVDAIAQAANRYYPEIRIEQEEKDKAACGLRPVSPDGMPYIGRSAKCDNLTIATGHAMMGWSLGPATGKLVEEIIAGKKTSMPVDAFHPDRKF